VIERESLSPELRGGHAPVGADVQRHAFGECAVDEILEPGIRNGSPPIMLYVFDAVISEDIQRAAASLNVMSAGLPSG
jgi:hypothetical protein